MIRRVTSLLALVLLLFLSACEKAPINGKIEGQWRLEQLITVKDNQTVTCKNIYYSITRMVTEVAQKGGTRNLGSFIARTEYQDNETLLILRDFKKRASTSDNGENATVEQLLPFGINDPQQTSFHVVESTHNRLVLESDYARLVFKKF